MINGVCSTKDEIASVLLQRIHIEWAKRESEAKGAKLLTTIAWRSKKRRNYALEGSVFIAGAVVQWLRDGLGIIKHSNDIEPLASSVPDNRGVYFVPAFVGLGAPY